MYVCNDPAQEDCLLPKTATFGRLGRKVRRVDASSPKFGKTQRSAQSHGTSRFCRRPQIQHAVLVQKKPPECQSGFGKTKTLPKLAILDHLTKRKNHIMPKGFVTVRMKRGWGLCNQLHAIASASIVAHWLDRTLVLPRLNVRNNAMDFKARIPRQRVVFGDLLDQEFFANHVGIPVTAKQKTSRRAFKFPKAVVETRDKIRELRRATRGARVVEIVAFRAVAPTSDKAKAFMQSVLRVCRPCHRLMKVVVACQTQLPAVYDCVHFRFEEDWQKFKKVQGTILDARSVIRRLREWLPTKAKVPVYLCGDIPSEQLRTFEACKDFRFVDKNKVWPPASLGLKFEEKAIIDFELAKKSRIFVGATRSTFSQCLFALRQMFHVYQAQVHSQWRTDKKSCMFALIPFRKTVYYPERRLLDAHVGRRDVSDHVRAILRKHNGRLKVRKSTFGLPGKKKLRLRYMFNSKAQASSIRLTSSASRGWNFSTI